MNYNCKSMAATVLLVFVGCLALEFGATVTDESQWTNAELKMENCLAYGGAHVDAFGPNASTRTEVML